MNREPNANKEREKRSKKERRRIQRNEKTCLYYKIDWYNCALPSMWFSVIFGSFLSFSAIFFASSSPSLLHKLLCLAYPCFNWNRQRRRERTHGITEKFNGHLLGKHLWRWPDTRTKYKWCAKKNESSNSQTKRIEKWIAVAGKFVSRFDIFIFFFFFLCYFSLTADRFIKIVLFTIKVCACGGDTEAWAAKHRFKGIAYHRMPIDMLTILIIQFNLVSFRFGLAIASIHYSVSIFCIHYHHLAVYLPKPPILSNRRTVGTLNGKNFNQWDLIAFSHRKLHILFIVVHTYTRQFGWHTNT